MTNRIPSLDGLRAASITFVLLGHLGGTVGFPIAEGAVGYFAVAELGVRVFFVISGFLITGLLLGEIESTGTISLPRFYARRTMRIFPPYYVMLSFVALAAMFGALQLKPGDLLHALTYTMNYHADRAWALGHTWSLAVEEQFYLLWPAVLLVLRPDRGLKAAVGIILIVPVIRLIEWYAGWHALIGNSFETVADALAMGCVLAGSRDALWRDPRYHRLLTSRWFVIVPFIAIALSALSRPRLEFAVGITASNLCIAATIDWCVRFHEGRVGRVLNARPVAFFGVLSYSLYLWQQAFIDRTSAAATARFPVNVFLAVGCALASYYAVERPALRLRTKLGRRVRRQEQSRGEPQLIGVIATSPISPADVAGVRLPNESHIV